MSSIKKRHHFVSRFYLKGFVDPRNVPYIWIYEKGCNEVRKASSKDIAVIEDFYSFRKIDGTKNIDSFENFFQILEENAAPSIKKILKEEKITNEERSHLSTFIALQFLRVPSFRNDIKEMIESEIVSHQKGLASEKNRFTDYLDSFGPAKEEILAGTDEEELRSYIIDGKYKVRVDKDRSLLYIYELLFSIGSTIHQFYWNFLISPNSYKFVTCDNPFFYFDPKKSLSQQKGVGLMSPNTELSFPLSKDIAILATSKYSTDEYKNVSDKMVKEINRRTVISAQRFVFSSHKYNGLNKLIKEFENFRPKNIVEHFPSSDGILNQYSRVIVEDPK